jgi:N-acetylglucosamine-6-phosphate deacetylase
MNVPTCFCYARTSAIYGLLVIWANSAVAAPPVTTPVDGLRENPPGLQAFVGATIVTEAGRTIEAGTLVIRDGSIIAVGKGADFPAGAIVHDLAGKWIYPGLMDAYSEIPVTAGSGARAHWNSLVTPELNAWESYQPDSSINERLRRQGVVCRLVAPAPGVIKGKSCIVSTSDLPGAQSLWKASAAQHLRLGMPRNRSGRGFPSSPMGAVALARQTFMDAEWYPRAWKAFQSNPSLPQPERNLALESLAESISLSDRFVIDSASELYLLRADAFAREFSLNAILRGSGQEYQRLDAVRATGRSIILPLNFPKPPAVDTPEAVHAASLSQLLHWDLAPENPARLHAAGVRFALCSAELSNLQDFLPRVRMAVERGLPADVALAALTTTPAEMFGIQQRFGTIAPGKSASFVVTDGDLFAAETKIEQTWIDGTRFPNEGADTLDVRGSWEVRVTNSDPGISSFQVVIQGKPEKLKGHIAISKAEGKSEKLQFSKLALRDRVLSGRFPGALLELQGSLQFSATLMELADQPLKATGRLALPDGSELLLAATRLPEDLASQSQVASPKDESSQEDSPKEDSTKEDSSQDLADDDPQEAEVPEKELAEAGKEKSDQKKLGPALFEVNFPLGALGRSSTPEQPELLVFQNATIWTCTDLGVIQSGTVIVQQGTIVAVGKDLPVPDGAVVIDATGKHLTPGMIDCHSHTATDGGINESTQSITAEVRVGDFVNCDDTDIYRQLAGGITTINILHGSANPIGGQNQVIKLRWGELYEQMRFSEAPSGIKFALGENVKRSNWSESSGERYPISRMGVEQIVRDAFQAAKEYQAQWSAWSRDHQTLPPRKDLELEALAEVLRGERWVHCHSYRQDEILALLRTCEEFGIRIATLQHILEGYKVADVMARHGAMASAFSDWWAYKVEVYDAIPYNGALMHQAGIVVSFNSDDRELARHMNHEAAKAVRYGNIDPEEALKFVTLNPAKQLRIDSWVGAIEAGKHADLVLWSGPPLSLLSRCEQTWIDGRRFFDIQEDQQQRQTARAQRAQLVQKVLDSGQSPDEEGQQPQAEESLWPLEDEFCRARNLR